MKKLLSCMVTIVIIATIALLPAEGYSKPKKPKWRLYDNFNSGVIDPDRWIIMESSGTFSIENDMVKFVHERENPGVLNFLLINREPEELEKIKGIRVTVRVNSCDSENSNVLGGITGVIAKEGDNYVIDSLAVQTGLEKRIFSRLLVFEPGIVNWVHDLFFGHFGYPVDVLGNTFTITMVFSRKVMTYKVEGLGTILFKLPEKLDLSDVFGKGIYTQSINGESCVVYFDDVYILK